MLCLLLIKVSSTLKLKWIKSSVINAQKQEALSPTSICLLIEDVRMVLERSDHYTFGYIFRDANRTISVVAKKR